MRSISELQKLYQSGVNIMEYLRDKKNINYNDSEIIEMSYDLQADVEIEWLLNPEFKELFGKYCTTICNFFSKFEDTNSILEAGTGNATIITYVLRAMGEKFKKAYGCDLSFSRLLSGKSQLDINRIQNYELCMADLKSMPYATSSIDLVYSCHSIEPNRDSEETIISELYRVARKYLIMLEPSYEFAPNEAKERMDKHKYCKGILQTCKNLGLNVTTHELFPISTEPLNPTVVTVVEKPHSDIESSDGYICPISKTPLHHLSNYYYSSEAFLSYPVIEGIPCLRPTNAIISSKLSDIKFNNVDTGKTFKVNDTSYILTKA